jgi:hypothetical protein
MTGIGINGYPRAVYSRKRYWGYCWGTPTTAGTAGTGLISGGSELPGQLSRMARDDATVGLRGCRDCVSVWTGSFPDEVTYISENGAVFSMLGHLA